MTDVRGLLPYVAPHARVALLGGSFNPPHIAHALLAHAVLLSEPVDVVWVLPCADHPFGKALAPLEDREAMCQMAFMHLGDRVSVVPVEQALPQPSYTVQTLRALREARPDVAYSWVVGSDILDELPRWREPEELQRLCSFIVVPRAGFRQEGRLQLTLPEVASRDIRARLARGEDVRGFVPREVADHIEARGLYRAADGGT